jgi:pSer/pThr/pTyr-binding forkhead associated (FHA) protein
MIEFTRTVDQPASLRQTQPCLVVLNGVQKGQAFWLDQPSNRIGRADDCEICLHDSSVSRVHAEVVQGQDGWLLRDCDSKNGSMLSDRNIVGESPMRDGDLCRFGAITLQFFMVQTIQAIAADRYQFRGMSLDADGLRVIGENSSASLTETEFRILATLMRRPGRVISAPALMRAAYPRERVVAESTIASHLRNLRRKLQGLGLGEDLIQSHYGRGYALRVNKEVP